MATKREVKVFITGDTSGLEQAASKVSGISGKMKGALAGVGAGVGLAAIGKGLLNVANQFKDAALEVDKFRGATGLSARDASKAVEAFGDLGIETGTLQGAIGKFNKALGKSDQAFKKYNVNIERTADGNVDVNKSFINAIKALAAMEDPTKRAAAGADLFGRSWQELAPIIGIADQLEAQLSSVGEAQIFDEAEIEKARRLRDAQNELDDAVGALKLNLAEGLIPALSAGAEWMSTLDPKVVSVGGGLLVAALAVSKLSGALSLLAANPALIAIAALAVTVWKLVEGINKLGGGFTPQGFTPEAAARINARSPGTIDAAGNATGVAKDTRSNWQAALGGIKSIFKADGGPVMAGSSYVVGERGPELFVPGQSGHIVPNGAGAGVVIQNMNVTVNGEQDYRKVRVMLERELARIQRGGKMAVA